MKQCPCCDKNSLNDEEVNNSLSHIDNKTYVCNDCGAKESYMETAPYLTDEIDVGIYNRFKERCKK